MDKIFKPWTTLHPTPAQISIFCFLLPRVETDGHKKSNPRASHISHARNVENIDIWGRGCHSILPRLNIFCPSTVSNCKHFIYYPSAVWPWNFATNPTELHFPPSGRINGPSNINMVPICLLCKVRSCEVAIIWPETCIPEGYIQG